MVRRRDVDIGRVVGAMKASREDVDSYCSCLFILQQMGKRWLQEVGLDEDIMKYAFLVEEEVVRQMINAQKMAEENLRML